MNSSLCYFLLVVAFATFCPNGQAIPTSSEVFALSAADRAYNAKMTALENNEKRLIKTSLEEPAKWMSHGEIAQLQAKHQGFMDVTFSGEAEEEKVITGSRVNFPSRVTQQQTARDIMAITNTDLMKSALKTLTQFNNRYYRSSTGRDSAEWLFKKVQELVTENADPALAISVKQFTHSGWDQKSIIARIEGSENPEQVIIVGAHQDSIAGFFGSVNARAPGGDDDGSGTVTILEAFRALLNKKFRPKLSVEFQWYSGEEAGLLGSQDIAKAYKSKGVSVKAMLQLDMTGYPVRSGPSDIGIVTDFTDPGLNTLMKSLIKEYTPLPAGEFKCGYGCSDHASWNKQGYPSVFPFESSKMRENNKIHTSSDTYDIVNFDHALHFVKLAIGFVVELAAN